MTTSAPSRLPAESINSRSEPCSEAFTLRSVEVRSFDNSGLCLIIAGGNTERNIVSVQYTCDHDPSRRWRYTVVDATTFRLVNLHSGLCLTIAGGGTDRNATAVQYPCDGDRSCDWKISSRL
jgi:hypothetical protein